MIKHHKLYKMKIFLWFYLMKGTRYFDVQHHKLSKMKFFLWFYIVKGTTHFDIKYHVLHAIFLEVLFCE